jgi:hypothetical protein
VEVCVAVAVVSLSARSYPAFVRENLKWQKEILYAFEYWLFSH